MFNMIIGMIKKLINTILENPMASTIIVSLIDDLKDEGGKMLGVVVSNIQAVAARDDLNSQEKFIYVFEATKQQFPNAATSLINTVIEAAYRSYTQGKF